MCSLGVADHPLNPFPLSGFEIFGEAAESVDQRAQVDLLLVQDSGVPGSGGIGYGFSVGIEVRPEIGERIGNQDGGMVPGSRTVVVVMIVGFARVIGGSESCEESERA